MPARHKHGAMKKRVQQGNDTTVPYDVFNHPKTKRRQLYLKTQSVPRSKHFLFQF